MLLNRHHKRAGDYMTYNMSNTHTTYTCTTPLYSTCPLCSRLLFHRDSVHQLRAHRGKLLADAKEGALRLAGLFLVATNHCTDEALESAGTDNLLRKVSVQ